MTSSPGLRTRVLAVAAAFALNGLAFGAWAARIPAVKAQTGLDDAAFGFAVLASATGAILTMVFGGWLGGRFGTHRVTPLALVVCAAMLPFMGAAWNYPSLTVSLLLYGIGQGTMDVCMNANGVAVEHAGAGPIMSRLHGSWAVGSFTGALISSAAAGAGIGTLPEFTVGSGFLLAAAAVLAILMLPDRHASLGGLRLPTGRLALLGAISLMGLLAEDSANTWSGIYLHGTLGADEGTAGLAVAAFTGCLAASRLAGDHLGVIVGSLRLVSGGALLSAVGLLVALLTGVPAIAIGGFAVMGLGIAAVVPTTFRAGGAQPGIPPPVGIASVSTMGYAGGLIGPALIGSVSQLTTLRVSLGLIVVILVGLALGSRTALQPRT